MFRSTTWMAVLITFLTCTNLPAKIVVMEDSATDVRVHQTDVFSLEGGWTLSTSVFAGKSGLLVVRVTARGDNGRFRSWSRSFADADAYRAGVGTFGREIAQELSDEVTP